MIKMLHTADLGLRNLPYGGINPKTGLNRRFEDVLNNFKYIVSLAVKENVKYFVIAGDINEERNPESILIERFSSYVADLISVDIKVIIIAGNHDLDSSIGTSTSISYLKSLGLVNTYIADLGPDTFEFDDIVFHCLPTMYYSQLNLDDNVALSNWLSDYLKKIKLIDNKFNVLVSHYSLEDTFYGLDVDEAVLFIDDLKKFDYVALGHIHKYEMRDEFKGGFSGSLFVKDFGEQKDKYVNIVEFKPDPDVDIVKWPIPEREFVEFKLDGLDKTPDELLEIVKTECHDIKDKIVKLVIRANKRINPKLIYDQLKSLDPFHYTPISWDIVRDDALEDLEVSEGMTDIDLVNTYLKSFTTKNEITDKVRDYIKTIIKTWNDEINA